MIPMRFPSGQPSSMRMTFSRKRCRASQRRKTKIRRHANGEDAEVLDIKTVYGLFEALTFLSDGGNANASDLGHHLMRQAKGDA